MKQECVKQEGVKLEAEVVKREQEEKREKIGGWNPIKIGIDDTLRRMAVKHNGMAKPELAPKTWNFDFQPLCIYANGANDLLGCPTGDEGSHLYLGHTPY